MHVYSGVPPLAYEKAVDAIYIGSVFLEHMMESGSQYTFLLMLMKRYICRRNRTTVLCTAATEHENHPILSPSASVRAAAVAPAAMSESDHSEHSVVDTHKSAADTHKSADTGDFGQSKNTTFRGSKSEFHPALAVSNIRNHIPIILEMEKDQYDGDHPSQM
ncbi:hypothetical protein KIW84_064222 [Lathyrus oleraceus]|uniref:Uncharacterized protein n=1 Tax=Pisum sativum TaxID=3888 RepID=A0A9D4WB35_PEA|nr:hypothetical protein KIW84_064222 [Pisum sativum]